MAQSNGELEHSKGPPAPPSLPRHGHTIHGIAAYNVVDRNPGYIFLTIS
jgi:hypothetical protein